MIYFHLDEGLKEIFSTLKAKFKKVFSYIKNVVVRFGTYFLPADENGDLLPVISPLTAGAAYKDGSINKKSTFSPFSRKARLCSTPKRCCSSTTTKPRL